MKHRPRFCFVILALAIAGIASTGCSPDMGKKSEAVQAESSPADSTALRNAPNTGERTIAEIDSRGKDIYNAAKMQDWNTAGRTLQQLHQAVDNLQRNDLKTKAEQTTASLAGAIADKDTIGTMKESNLITSVAADLNSEYHPREMGGVALLGYYARELEIWSRAPNGGSPASIIQNLHQHWNVIRPMLQNESGLREAAKFEQILQQLDTAKTPAQISNLAQAALSELGQIEKTLQL